MNDEQPIEDPKARAAEKVTLIQLLPNVLTVVAICAGLTAIRFGLQGSYELAVQLILLAAVLDGLDGRLARALKSESGMGAELDSLADFLNFGVAPPGEGRPVKWSTGPLSLASCDCRLKRARRRTQQIV